MQTKFLHTVASALLAVMFLYHTLHSQCVFDWTDADISRGDVHQPLLSDHIQTWGVLPGHASATCYTALPQQTGHCHLDVAGAWRVSTFSDKWILISMNEQIL